VPMRRPVPWRSDEMVTGRDGGPAMPLPGRRPSPGGRPEKGDIAMSSTSEQASGTGRDPRQAGARTAYEPYAASYYTGA